MANSDRGTKRTDPDTGKKFYDLNMDPIVSPYTGKSYPRSFFEQITSGKSVAGRKIDDEDEMEDEDDTDEAAPETVSLEEADAEESGGEDIPDTDDVEVEEDLGDDEEDVFLEDEDEEDSELGFEVGDDEDR